MKLPLHKTKIVCTIGPSSSSLPKLEAMIKNGMNVARLNFSHACFEEHRENIRNIRKAASQLKRCVNILIDLPGIKIRIGELKNPSILLKEHDRVVLTTQKVLGTPALISVDYKRLPEIVFKGGIIYINDGFIQLKVERVFKHEVHCSVMIGGMLLSHKGLNLPGAHLSMNPITQKDFDAIEFGLKENVTTFGLSFIEKGEDMRRVREFARKRGKDVCLVAKIERKKAVDNFDEILAAADAVMVARGDLGIEIPMEQVPIVQKQLIGKANLMGRPVITATQMLGSMTHNIRPTRAEVNDVANAILDGTDAVMLSEETAIGDYPVETVKTMANIAVSTEAMYHQGHLSKNIREHMSNALRPDGTVGAYPDRSVGAGPDRSVGADRLTMTDTICLNAVEAVEKLKAKFILAQTSSGSTVRHISRFKPPCWILAFSSHRQICEFFTLSYGVYPFLVQQRVNKPEVLLSHLKKAGLVRTGDTIILTERRFSSHPGHTDSLGVVNCK